MENKFTNQLETILNDFLYNLRMKVQDLLDATKETQISELQKRIENLNLELNKTDVEIERLNLENNLLFQITCT